MKPVTPQTTDGKSSNFAVVMQPDNKETTSFNQSVFIKRVVVAVLAFAVVAGIVLGCVYFGITSAREINKEALVQFRTASGEMIFEKITVTDDEEVFETANITAIYDFSTNLMLFKHATADVCYVRHFNVSEVKLPGEIYDKLTTSEMSVEVDDPIKQTYESTGVEASRDQLSERGQQLCRGSKIFWIVEKAAVSRERRAGLCMQWFIYCNVWSCYDTNISLNSVGWGTSYISC